MPGDFWPTIRAPKLRMPVGILRQQASALGRKTKNIVIAKVVSDQEGKNFVHALELVAPVLGNYTYVVLTVQHPISVYPMRVIDHLRDDQVREARTEEDFMGILREILSSAEMKRLLEVLLAQSESLKPRAHPVAQEPTTGPAQLLPLRPLQ
ncbi:MAG: hypothetical protein FJ290_10430 [Planctomycetes bacterium]|nr:hypothetical protein [Planctomycetota bacterium]